MLRYIYIWECVFPIFITVPRGLQSGRVGQMWGRIRDLAVGTTSRIGRANQNDITLYIPEA